MFLADPSPAWAPPRPCPAPALFEVGRKSSGRLGIRLRDQSPIIDRPWRARRPRLEVEDDQSVAENRRRPACHFYGRHAAPAGVAGAAAKQLRRVLQGTSGKDTSAGTAPTTRSTAAARPTAFRRCRQRPPAGRNGPDTLAGGSDNDLLYGDEAADLIYGQDGDDQSGRHRSGHHVGRQWQRPDQRRVRRRPDRGRRRKRHARRRLRPRQPPGRGWRRHVGLRRRGRHAARRAGERSARRLERRGHAPAALLGPPDGLGPGPCAGLADRRGQVVAHGPVRQVQLAGRCRRRWRRGAPRAAPRSPDPSAASPRAPGTRRPARDRRPAAPGAPAGRRRPAAGLGCP